jgi:hypothetical protein
VSSATVDRQALRLHSAVKLFANRTDPKAPDFGFKYVNPNLVAVATTIPAPTPTDDKVGKAKVSGPSVVLYLVDGVTGAVLSQMVHPNAAGPVTLLLVEHFVLYHYLNTKTSRYQLGVWQLFEDATDAAAHTVAQGLLNLLTGHQPPVRSAFSMPPPAVTRNAYAYPSGLKALGTTVTTKGITPKLVLAGTPTGQVVGLPLSSLEAAPTHYVPIPPTAILTYNRTVHRLRSIRTAPTTLESSSHLLAVGLDLFYTRVAPSKPYDLLGSDFAYLPLMATISVLFIATVAARWFSRRKVLALAWA